MYNKTYMTLTLFYEQKVKKFLNKDKRRDGR